VNKNLANQITIFRLILIPFFILAFELDLRFSALLIFLIASFSDFVDGYVARKYNQISDFGKLIDPLADKILVSSALILLVSRIDLTGNSLIPAWLVVLIIAREFLITGLRSFAATRSIVLAADTLGKYKTTFQMLAIIILIPTELVILNSFLGFDITTRDFGLFLLFISFIFSYISGFKYIQTIIKAVK